MGVPEDLTHRGRVRRGRHPRRAGRSVRRDGLVRRGLGRRRWRRRRTSEELRARLHLRSLLPLLEVVLADRPAHDVALLRRHRPRWSSGEGLAARRPAALRQGATRGRRRAARQARGALHLPRSGGAQRLLRRPPRAAPHRRAAPPAAPRQDGGPARLAADPHTRCGARRSRRSGAAGEAPPLPRGRRARRAAPRGPSRDGAPRGRQPGPASTSGRSRRAASARTCACARAA